MWILILGQIKDELKSFVISGTIQPSGNNQIDKAVIINEASGNSLFHKAGKYDSVIIAALSADYVDAVQQEITGIYGKNIGIIVPKALMQTRQQFQSGNSAFTVAIAFIALLVGAVGIITTLYTSVSERTKEIGTMKAIGAKSKFILILFLVEALFIGFLGATLGIVSGIGGAYLTVGGIFVPTDSLAKYKSDFTSAGFQVISNHNFVSKTSQKDISGPNTLLLYSTHTPIENAIANLKPIIDSLPYR